MAFSPSFSVTQTIGSNSVLIFTDISSGSSGFVTERHIYLRKADGTFLVPEGSSTDYIVWPLATNPFSVDVLDKDYAFQIIVEWFADSLVIPTSGLWAWFYGSNGVTVTDATTEVTDWADQSGNGYDMSAESGEEPEYVSSALNSLPAISSYGLLAEIGTSVDFPDLSTGGTVFIVAKQSSVNGATNSDNSGVFIGAGSGVNMEIKRGSSSISGMVSIEGGIDATTYAESNPLVADDTFVTIRLKNDGTNNLIAINNGTENTLAADGSGYSATPFTVFKTLGGAQGNKQIAEIIIYSRELSGSEITQVETYLQTKYAHY